MDWRAIVGGGLLGILLAILVDRLYVRRRTRRDAREQALADARLTVLNAGRVLRDEIVRLEAERERLIRNGDQP